MSSNTFLDTFSYKLIYVFRIPIKTHEGLLKIGETTMHGVADISKVEDNSEKLNEAAKARIDSVTKTAGINYELLYTTVAIDNDNKVFSDRDVHNVLRRSGIEQVREELNNAYEWYRVDLSTAINAIDAVKDGRSSLHPGDISDHRSPFIFRKEQRDAIEKTIKQFTRNNQEKPKRAHMLWNAKMRFGKTPSALEVIRRMQFSRTIIITHRPDVSDGWYEDFAKIFYDDENYLYGSKTEGYALENLVNQGCYGRKLVYFASIQDLRGSKLVGGKFEKNDAIFNMPWDFVIVDEAHEGTQTELGNAVIQELITSTDKTKALYLSGTPFNLLGPESHQQFSEDEVYTWNYIMEQQAKLDWVEQHLDSNPYAMLPRMNIFTYDLGKILRENIYHDIEDKAFNFREFFRVWTGDEERDFATVEPTLIGTFVHERDVKRFLDLLVEKGDHNYPFSTKEYQDSFRHTLWMLPGVKEAKALSKILREHRIFKHFEICNVAGDGDEEVKSNDALQMVRSAIGKEPENTYTITLSCGRLTTGVSVPEWSAVFMLSGSSSTSASSYLQTIFRVQTPAVIGNKVKTNAYVFDFAPDRTLKIIAEATNISTKAGARNDQSRIRSLLNFCPVISVSGSEMAPYDVNSILVKLKQAFIDRVATNGFDDYNLYNDRLLNLSELELKKFKNLKNLIGSRKRSSTSIHVNTQGLEEEKHDKKEQKNKQQLTPEELEARRERARKRRERHNAIAILRAIAIRIPLLVYGADINDDNEEINVDNFPNLIDDASWVEFMPKGVTKEKFKEFSKYFDNEIFVGASAKIRRKAKAADRLPPLERVQTISNIFATFKNPDKETVLTPWKVINMHMGQSIGGANFYKEGYISQIVIDDETTTRWVEHEGVTKNIFTTNSHILELNSKSGLYPLYAATSIYQNVKRQGRRRNITNLWKEIVRDNIYVICRTQMAAAITRRTLVGFNDKSEYKTNIIVLETMVEDMRDQYNDNYRKLKSLILNKKTWRKGNGEMKFDAVIGNPPYQSDAKQQIYTDFYLIAREVGDVVSLIFPSGWQDPKNANNLSKLNNDEIKKDKQIVFIDNRENVFPGITGAQWTNFILWIKGYDNKLEGAQLIYENGFDPIKTVLPIKEEDIKKPEEIRALAAIVESSEGFKSMQNITSVRKPYGLSTDVIGSPSKYNLPPFNLERENDDDITVFGSLNRRRVKAYIPKDYPLPRVTECINKYKVFVPYAWGGMDEKYWLGGTYSDVVIGKPNEICTETFLEQGCYNTLEEAIKHAKYIFTKFARACLYVNKISQHSTSAWGAVPVQDFKEEWWGESIDEINERLFEKYNIPEHIREFIRTKIQPKNTDDIKNIEVD